MTIETKPQLNILSIGWGVQSWALAAMMALDAIPSADYVIHADTTYERASTYVFARQWAPWLADHGITVETVQGRRNDVVMAEHKNSVMIPAFTIDDEGNKGQVRRQCTHDWKIVPIRRFLRQKMEARGIRLSPGVVQMMTGITTDEWQRMRDSDVAYIENTYPLIDLGMSRASCISWLEQHDLPVPEKSSCTFCPYASIKSWKQLKTANGPDWDQAVQVDEAIRDKRPPFALSVHPARKPLPVAVAIPEDFGATQPTFDVFEACESGFCWT